MKIIKYILLFLFFLVFKVQIVQSTIILTNHLPYPLITNELFSSSSEEKEWLGVLHLKEFSKFGFTSQQTGLSRENKKFFKNPELVDSWKVLGDFPSLRKIPTNLGVLVKVKDKFTYNGKAGQEALEEIFTGHKSAQKFVNNFKKYDEVIGEIDDIAITGVKSSSEVRILNKSSQVGKIVDGKLNVSYSGFGGDIVCDPSKTTTLLGKWKDPAGGGTGDIINSKLSKSGENLGGPNVLSEDVPKGWADQQIWDNVNEPWLRNAANRGDVIRVVSDPTKTTNIYKQGTELSFFGREHELLTKPVSQGGLGYTYNPSTFTYTK